MSKFSLLRISLLCGVILLFILFLRWSLHQDTDWRVGDKIQLRITLVEQPMVKWNAYRKEYFQFIQSRYNNQSVVISLPVVPELRMGDQVVISGVFENQVSDFPSSIFSPVIPETRWKIADSRIVVVESQTENYWWKSQFWEIKKRLVNFFRINLPRDQSAVFSGLVLGDKSSLSKEFYSSLQISGLLHVVVASGFNVMFVGSFVIANLLTIWRRQTAIIGSLLIVWLYIFIIGLEPPIVRAGVMMSIITFGVLLGRTREITRVFWISLVLMLIYNPVWVHSVSWQLSSFATAGLIYLFPILRGKITITFACLLPRENMFSKYPQVKNIVNGLYEGFLTTVAVQIAVFPILLYYFGLFSPIAPISNALLMGFIPIITISGMGIAMVSLFSEALASCLLYVVYPLVNLFVGGVHLFSELPGSFITISARVSTLYVYLYYLILILFVMLNNKKYDTKV